MAKRGESGLCRVVAVDKPVGMSSHDVVNRARRIFSERRVGHAGTLDPLASGVLILCIGPATRLDAYFTSQSKRYVMDISFGRSTETDDSEGEVLASVPVPESFYDWAFAEKCVTDLVGTGKQVPPVYSAIKVNGKKSYAEARKGNIIAIEPRDYTVFDAKLLEVNRASYDDGSEGAVWRVDMCVSKGTYMRSIARDLGRHLQNAAHVSYLRRTASGAISIEDCVTLDELERFPEEGTIDPVRTAGCRFAFMREGGGLLNNGNLVPAKLVSLNEPIQNDLFSPCSCTTSVYPSADPPVDGEVVGLLLDNKLKAMYEYHESDSAYHAKCVFPIGVERGTNL